MSVITVRLITKGSFSRFYLQTNMSYRTNVSSRHDFLLIKNIDVVIFVKTRRSFSSGEEVNESEPEGVKKFSSFTRTGVPTYCVLTPITSVDYTLPLDRPIQTQVSKLVKSRFVV